MKEIGIKETDIAKLSKEIFAILEDRQWKEVIANEDNGTWRSIRKELKQIIVSSSPSFNNKKASAFIEEIQKLGFTEGE